MKFLLILLVIYAAFIAFLSVAQESLIFFPRKMTEKEWKETAEAFKADYVTIRVGATEHLRGWFLSDHSEQPRPTVIVFGGNAMNMRDVVPLFASLPNKGINALLADYRGYGLSDGKPGAETMKADAEKIFDAAAAHPYVDSESIVTFGISIGTGVATRLASVRPAAKLILLSPFTSTADIGWRMFPFVPKPLIRLLLRHKFDNLALAPKLTQPVLIVAGANDRETPPGHAEKIAEAWGTLRSFDPAQDRLGSGQGPAELLMVPGRGHNDLLGDGTVWEKVVAFITD